MLIVTWTLVTTLLFFSVRKRCPRVIALAGLSSVLVSYVRSDGNFLEHPELQKGLLWGLARLADVRPEKVLDAGPFLLPFLESQDPEHRGLAALTAGFLQEKSLFKNLENLVHDPADITLYWDLNFIEKSVGVLAKNALTRY